MATLPVLYSFRRCPYAMRARLALAVSGQSVELREILLKRKPAAMLEASPKGTVPVLVLPSGQVLDESLDVMLWALKQNDPQNWLETTGSASSQELLRTNDGPFKHWLDRSKYSVRFPEGSLEDYRAAAVHILEDWNMRISRNQGGLLSARWGLADWGLLPFVRQFAMIDKTWFNSLPLQALQQWLEQGLTSDLFAKVMLKHPLWDSAEGPGLRIDWS